MKLKLFFFIVLMTAAFATQAQSITTATLRWSAATTMDIDTGSLESGNAGVVSYPTKIDWIGEDGNVQYSFTITNTVGSWADVSANGLIRFDVSANGTNGNIQFSKDNTGTYVRLILYMPDAAQITELKINSIKTL
ncbi:MAG: hypothetical protein JSS79_08580 [Bacteroidetes bacterium]|nr:hypothetical protein [Bacteroidota bacterium]